MQSLPRPRYVEKTPKNRHRLGPCRFHKHTRCRLGLARQFRYICQHYRHGLCRLILCGNTDVTKIADPHSLALHEALMIEGGWDQYSDKELASYLPSSSYTPARIRDQLASGELVLLKEIPAVPVFRLISGSIVPAESASGAIAESALTALTTRFENKQPFRSGATGQAHADSLSPPTKLDYTPEAPVIEPATAPLPPPVVISENFGLPPLGPKVFAKSCTRPSGDTDSNEGEEKASNFGTLAMLAPATVTSPGANGLRPLGLISGSAMRLAKEGTTILAV